MKTRVLLAFALCSTWVLARQSPDQSIQGFRRERVAAERAAEQKALGAVSEESASKMLSQLTKEPHHAGSAGDRWTAEYVQGQFKEFGFDSKIVEYQVLLPYPLEVKVSMLEPTAKELAIKENVEFHPDALIPFNSYSPSGDVTAEVVYANYALADDFKRLKESGISVAGKIVLARYGKVYRGLKVLEATKAGAIGIVLYSDPSDDGYMAGDMYPAGPMRPWDGVQRGSIRFAETYSGDPLTPGVAATRNAKRIKAGDDPDMPRIPCTPISYGDAQYLLKPLGGPAVQRDWQGGLPFTYHIGPGPTKVRMQLKMDYQIRPIWDNIAELKGTEEPEKKIILGGHRDAWIFGAQDPNSGSTVILEAARVIGEQVKKGWKPKRTMVFAQWDGEEFGLIGSTEWGEEFKDDLRKDAVVYMNFDASISGPTFSASSAPSLDTFIQSITKDVQDPGKQKSVFAGWWYNQNKEKMKSPEDTVPERAAANLGRMGGGSDHVVFQNHIGVPSMGFGFGGPGGIYHSYYDNFDWMSRFGDPGFHYHAAAARLAVIAAMRMANADVLPFTVAPYADEVIKQLAAVEKRLAGIPQAPPLALASLKTKAEAWKAEAQLVDLRLAHIPSDFQSAGAANALLMSVERSFVLSKGLPGREWYKHRMVAASGYASIGLPGISGAVEDGNWKTAAEEIALFERILDELIATTKKMRSLM